MIVISPLKWHRQLRYIRFFLVFSPEINLHKRPVTNKMATVFLQREISLMASILYSKSFEQKVAYFVHFLKQIIPVTVNLRGSAITAQQTVGAIFEALISLNIHYRLVHKLNIQGYLITAPGC